MKCTSNNFDRARAWMAAQPGAVSGDSGHDRTFGIACKLVRLGLSPAQVLSVLLEYNRRCSPPWTDRELRHKLEDAFRFSRPGLSLGFSRSTRLQPQIDPATAIDGFLKGFCSHEVDLWEASTIRPPDDWKLDGICLVETLYRAGELVNFVTRYVIDAKGKAQPADNGETIERDALLTRWRKYGMPRSEAGGWLRMNPLDGNGTRDANVATFRFALVEIDHVPIEFQLSLLSRLPLPVSVILASGGRSLHAWVTVNARTLTEYKELVTRMLALLARFGVDAKNSNPGRMSRLPGLVREIGGSYDPRQHLLYLNPKPKQSAIL